MARKKQERRRAKQRRHELEDVYLDAEGNEITQEEYEALVGERDTAGLPSNGGGAAARPLQRGGRTIQPPSWRRVIKRGLIFAPLMYVTLYLLTPDRTRSVAQVAFSTAYLLLLFIPFSYFMDRFMYRRFARQAQGGGAKRR